MISIYKFVMIYYFEENKKYCLEIDEVVWRRCLFVCGGKLQRMTDLMEGRRSRA